MYTCTHLGCQELFSVEILYFSGHTLGHQQVHVPRIDSEVSGIVTDKKNDSMAKREATLNSFQASHERTPRRWKITEPLLPSLCSPVQFFIGHNLLYWKIK